jgi:hypothetical protein
MDTRKLKRSATAALNERGYLERATINAVSSLQDRPKAGANSQ